MPPGPSITLRPLPGANDGNDTGGTESGKDAYTYGIDPDANYGDETLLIGQAKSDCNHADGIAYLQFDLTGLPRKVHKALLGLTHLPHADHCYSNCSIQVFFYRVDEPWDEMHITYNRAPRLGPPVFGPLRIAFPNDRGTVEYDITGIYEAWQANEIPNYGLAFCSPTVGCNNSAVFFGFYSSDYPDPLKRPYLRVLTGGDPDDPSVQLTRPRLSNSKGAQPHDSSQKDHATDLLAASAGSGRPAAAADRRSLPPGDTP
ncbi:MAG: DNRLRE domain-containing protein [Acidobacteriota bacterium]